MVMIVGTPTVLDNAMQYLPANIYQQYSILRSAPYFIEILNTDVNKRKRGTKNSRTFKNHSRENNVYWRSR